MKMTIVLPLSDKDWENLCTMQNALKKNQNKKKLGRPCDPNSVATLAKNYLASQQGQATLKNVEDFVAANLPGLESKKIQYRIKQALIYSKIAIIEGKNIKLINGASHA